MADRYAPLPTWQVLTGTLPPGDDRYLPPPPMADRLLTLKEALKGLDDFFYHYHHGDQEGLALSIKERKMRNVLNRGMINEALRRGDAQVKGVAAVKKPRVKPAVDQRGVIAGLGRDRGR